jgi:hypothetical protein
MRYVRQFFSFLYDFLVGDAWELFVGPIVALVIGWFLVANGVSGAVVGGLLFIGVLIVAAVNLGVALRGSA